MSSLANLGNRQYIDLTVGTARARTPPPGGESWISSLANIGNRQYIDLTVGTARARTPPQAYRTHHPPAPPPEVGMSKKLALQERIQKDPICANFKKGRSTIINYKYLSPIDKIFTDYIVHGPALVGPGHLLLY